jgi:hypothetical protein
VSRRGILVNLASRSTRFWRIGKKNFRERRTGNAQATLGDARRDQQYSLIGARFGRIQSEMKENFRCRAPWM